MADREKLMSLIWHKQDCGLTHNANGQDFVTYNAELADHLIANDVTIPVRCKGCKHFGGHGACHCHAADENGTPIFVREDDFCSYGERRTDV